MKSDIAELCTWLRERSGLNRTEFARRVGVSRFATLHWENDQAMIPLDTFLSLCRVSGVSPLEAIQRLPAAKPPREGEE
jgi:DNA-binding XRE family transcriptional regulator